MKAITQVFKNNVKLFGRELDSIITYELNGDTIELGNENLNSVSPHYEGGILKSVMKQLDIDSNEDIPLETIINFRFGVKVRDDDVEDYRDNYDYIDFGNYVVYKSEKQEDTNSYKITCYDKMLYSMKEYENMAITYPISVRSYINTICTHLGLTFANASNSFANYDKLIPNELYISYNSDTQKWESLGYTFRDVLDELAEVTASTICINDNDELEIRYITNSGDTIDEEYLKDINVNFGESYGPINTIVLSRSAGADNIYFPSTLPENPVELKISDNQIMNGNDRDSFLPAIYNKLNGLSYYINDYSSTGITYYDLCDRYNVQIGGNTYSCVMLNDDIQITQGLEENIYTDLPEESVTDYTKADSTDRRINQTYFIVDKQNQTIESVVTNVTDQNEKISQITQTVDELNSKISDIADITVSGESIIANVPLSGVNESEPILLKVRPINNNISYLYPRSNLYPSSSLYSTIRTIRFHNNTTNEDFDYILPDDLLYYDSENYDEFTLSYESQICSVTKRCKYNADGTVGLLETPITIDYASPPYSYPIINLTEGDYTVSILTHNSGYIYVTLMAKNIYTTQFYTKAETNSYVQQTARDINIGVDQKLSNYSTTDEMNTAISISAGEINQVVSHKVGENEIISKINQTPEQITINANKLNLQGYVTASDLSGSGTTTINGANIITGTLSADQIRTGTLTASAINLGNGLFSVNTSGVLTAKSGTIGGWTLAPGSITNTSGSGITTLNSNGRISFSNGNYFFGVGNGSNHPVASALSTRNVNFWSSLSSSGSSGTWIGGVGIYGDIIGTLCNAGQTVVMGRANSDLSSVNDSYSFRFNASSSNWTLRTDGGSIYLRPQGNNSLYIYGSYDNNLGYHYGRSGKFAYQNGYLYFVNGIFVGRGNS